MTNKTINKILIANRGEIACRIIRTCNELGIKTVAIYSDPDARAKHVEMADEAYALGGSTAAESYLNADKIIEIAKAAKADAIHPGYGFMSENEEFAKKCQDNHLIFIGPSPQSISAMGSKSNAKKLMQENHVPTIPGYFGKDQTIKTLIDQAEKISYPILIKAAAGGGGKGMRIVRSSDQLKEALEATKREGKSYFGSDEVMLEKYFDKVRHIEVQIMGDSHGNMLHLFERECSLQRRYQKVIEESPSPALNDKLRKEITEAAVRAAKAIGYENAGTVEFILDDKDNFYFLEVNTRLQVEHPVTEEITGLDLVAMQILVAEGKALPIKQEDVKMNGYAIECRIYAENPAQDFLPLSGEILEWDVSDKNARIETGIRSGDFVSIYYDPMIAKIITHGENREMAHRKMKGTLSEMFSPGITTNRDFLLNILNNKDFQEGKYSTHFIADHIKELLKPIMPMEDSYSFFVAAILWGFVKRKNKSKLPDGLIDWHNNPYQPQYQEYTIEEKDYKITYNYLGDNQFKFLHDKEEYHASIVKIKKDKIIFTLDDKTYTFKIFRNKNDMYVQDPSGDMKEIVVKERFPSYDSKDADTGYLSPMPAQVLKLVIKPGEAVKMGDTIVVLSSMKMEIAIEAKEDGVLKEYYVKELENIPKNKELFSLEISK